MHCIETYEPEKTDDILRRHQRFPREMTTEKRAQKFHTDDALSPDLDSGVGGVICFLMLAFNVFHAVQEVR